METDTTWREFGPVNEEALRMFTPEPDTMRKALFEAFLSIFLCKGAEEAGQNTNPADESGSQEVLIPSFANELTLGLSVEPDGIQELQRAKLCLPETKVSLERHILSMDLWKLDVAEGIHRSWPWTPPPDGKFSMCNVESLLHGSGLWLLSNGKTVWEGSLRHVPAGTSDFGTLGLLQIPLRDSILKFRWIEFILAQTGFFNYTASINGRVQGQESHASHLSSILYFLGIFAGYWPSGAERAGISLSKSINWHFAQIHFRCFRLMDTPKKTLGSDGLKCQRQQGEIKFPGLRISLFRFEERRISIFRILSSTSTDSGLSGREISPSVYRVLILAEADVDFFAKDLKNSGLKWRDGCGGPIAFQGAIFPTLRIWEREWSKVLDQIDVWLSVKLNQTMDSEQITEWMFDVDFERSRLYFTVLQILRIFGECIRTVSADLKALDNLFLTRMMFSFTWLPSDDERLDLSSNWKSITKHQKDAEERLLRRLLDKTEEVKSLRDGLFHASSLREAKQSTTMAEQSVTMNRYVIIFTVVTVLYLPPSFISTVFGMTIFQKSVDQTTREYKVTMVVVSLITYLVALLSVIAVNWPHNKNKVLKWWKTRLQHTPVKDNSDTAPIPAQAAGSAPIPQESKTRDTERKAGPSNEQQDLESASNEEGGKRARFRSWWQKRAK